MDQLSDKLSEQKLPAGGALQIVLRRPLFVCAENIDVLLRSTLSLKKEVETL